MLELPIIRNAMKLSSFPECSPGTSTPDQDSDIQCHLPNKLEVHDHIEDVHKQTTYYGNLSNNSFRFQLEQDVERLQRLLLEEMQLNVVLQNALENSAVELCDLSCLPNNAQELFSDIASLENTVTRLEEEMVSLHFQLVQERNERRLVEYRLKQLSAVPQLICSQGKLNVNIADLVMQEVDISPAIFQHVGVGSLRSQIPVKGHWNNPNQLSEEIVHCMKNIFISLADSSAISSKSAVSSKSLSETGAPSTSPSGHLSSSSRWSLSELAAVSSWGSSPQINMQCSSETLATGDVFDPYKVRGKLSWSHIGSYGLAKEVSWMSVGKEQLEYAADALRRFRLLVEQLGEVNPIHLSDNEKLAFWINLYNALIMHAYLAYGVPKSDMKLFSLMQKAAYIVGGQSFSAACIEYIILKMKPPAHRPQTALLLAIHKLKVSEQQQKFSIEISEPLVTFALSCGTYSSPAVKVYTASNVAEELQEAQRDFVRASVGLTSKGKLLVPKMLHCFARGVVDDSKLAVWISRFLPRQQAALVEQCISQRRQGFLGSRNCGVLPYDSRFRYLFLPEASP